MIKKIVFVLIGSLILGFFIYALYNMNENNGTDAGVQLDVNELRFSIRGYLLV